MIFPSISLNSDIVIACDVFLVSFVEVDQFELLVDESDK